MPHTNTPILYCLITPLDGKYPTSFIDGYNEIEELVYLVKFLYIASKGNDGASKQYLPANFVRGMFIFNPTSQKL